LVTHSINSGLTRF